MWKQKLAGLVRSLCEETTNNFGGWELLEECGFGLFFGHACWRDPFGDLHCLTGVCRTDGHVGDEVGHGFTVVAVASAKSARPKGVRRGAAECCGFMVDLRRVAPDGR